jgi:hypothetical protein
MQADGNDSRRLVRPGWSTHQWGIHDASFTLVAGVKL